MRQRAARFTPDASARRVRLCCCVADVAAPPLRRWTTARSRTTKTATRSLTRATERATGHVVGRSLLVNTCVSAARQRKRPLSPRSVITSLSPLRRALPLLRGARRHRLGPPARSSRAAALGAQQLGVRVVRLPRAGLRKHVSTRVFLRRRLVQPSAKQTARDAPASVARGVERRQRRRCASKH